MKSHTNNVQFMISQLRSSINNNIKYNFTTELNESLKWEYV